MIEQRIPELSDKELESLHANAARLVQTGKPIQREQAEKLLPLLVAAMEERKAARLAKQSEARRAVAKLNVVITRGLKVNSDEHD